MADDLEKNAEKILEELNGCQGNAVDIGSYFHPDMTKLRAAMTPSGTMNALLAIIYCLKYLNSINCLILTFVDGS